MSESLATLRRKIVGSRDLQAVVRTMKAVAASSIGQYEKSVLALANYNRAIELGLSACLGQSGDETLGRTREAGGASPVIGAVIFGSDQGLVGDFNEVVVDFAKQDLATLPGTTRIWAVGERVEAGLPDQDKPEEHFKVPSSVQGIVPLVGQILSQSELLHEDGAISELHIFHNRPTSKAGYAPFTRKLLPLDASWFRERTAIPWPTESPAEVLGDHTATLRALIHEFLFISLFRACAESLASENASRLAAMERADRNIDELLDVLVESFHRLRQGAIDEELFDVISGFDALSD